jgi:6-phosphogluconolactonase
VAISANSKFVYVLSEMKSTLTTFAYDEAAGTLKQVQSLSTLPVNFQGVNDAAEVELDHSGKFLYASNRGENSIVVYQVDPAKGTLSFVQRVSTGGREPRHFTLDPAGKRLLVANQIIGDIVITQVEGASGQLSPAVESVKVSKPVCIVFVPEE